MLFSGLTLLKLLMCFPQSYAKLMKSSKAAKSSDWIILWKEAVPWRSRLSPYPWSTNMVVIKISPEIVFPTFGISPRPAFLHFQVWTIHTIHIPSVSKSCEFRSLSKCVFAKIISSLVSLYLKPHDRICQSNNTSSPTFIESSIGVIVGSEICLIVIEWSS